MYHYTYCFSISGTDWADFARTGGVTDAPASFITHHFMITITGKQTLVFFHTPPPLYLPSTEKKEVWKGGCDLSLC
jgi:hypothetical protein